LISWWVRAELNRRHSDFQSIIKTGDPPSFFSTCISCGYKRHFGFCWVLLVILGSDGYSLMRSREGMEVGILTEAISADEKNGMLYLRRGTCRQARAIGRGRMRFSESGCPRRSGGDGTCGIHCRPVDIFALPCRKERIQNQMNRFPDFLAIRI
jgi:hypothetical protein